MWALEGTLKEIVTRLNQTLARFLKLPDVNERLRARWTSTRAQSAGSIRTHHRSRYRQMVDGGEGE
jgi:hypothetical protein